MKVLSKIEMRFVTGGTVECQWMGNETFCVVTGWWGTPECSATYNAGGDCTGCDGGESCCKGGGCTPGLN